jgi:hypothetical protein
VWIDQLASAYEVIPMDAAMFREWARLMSGKSDALLEDAMIAATARVRGLIVVTRNVRVFKRLQVDVLNPFAAAEGPGLRTPDSYPIVAHRTTGACCLANAFPFTGPPRNAE